MATPAQSQGPEACPLEGDWRSPAVCGRVEVSDLNSVVVLNPPLPDDCRVPSGVHHDVEEVPVPQVVFQGDRGSPALQD